MRSMDTRNPCYTVYESITRVFTWQNSVGDSRFPKLKIGTMCIIWSWWQRINIFQTNCIRHIHCSTISDSQAYVVLMLRIEEGRETRQRANICGSTSFTWIPTTTNSLSPHYTHLTASSGWLRSDCLIGQPDLYCIDYDFMRFEIVLHLQWEKESVRNWLCMWFFFFYIRRHVSWSVAGAVPNPIDLAIFLSLPYFSSICFYIYIRTAILGFQ